MQPPLFSLPTLWRCQQICTAAVSRLALFAVCAQLLLSADDAALP